MNNENNKMKKLSLKRETLEKLTDNQMNGLMAGEGSGASACATSGWCAVGVCLFAAFVVTTDGTSLAATAAL